MSQQIERVMEQYGDYVQYIASLYIKDQVLAKQIAQDVFWEYFQRRYEYSGEPSLKRQLLKMTVRSCQRYGKPKKKWLRSVKDKETLEMPTNLIEKIWHLPFNFREVIILNRIEGFSVAEIAIIISCSEADVHTRLEHAKKLLGDTLDEKEIGNIREELQRVAQLSDESKQDILGKVEEFLLAQKLAEQKLEKQTKLKGNSRVEKEIASDPLSEISSDIKMQSPKKKWTRNIVFLVAFSIVVTIGIFLVNSLLEDPKEAAKKELNIKNYEWNHREFWETYVADNGKTLFYSRNEGNKSLLIEHNLSSKKEKVISEREGYFQYITNIKANNNWVVGTSRYNPEVTSKIYVYNRKSKKNEIINIAKEEDPERFVEKLVLEGNRIAWYEHNEDNGEILIMAYDLKKKKKFQIASVGFSYMDTLSINDHKLAWIDLRDKKASYSVYNFKNQALQTYPTSYDSIFSGRLVGKKIYSANLKESEQSYYFGYFSLKTEKYEKLDLPQKDHTEFLVQDNELALIDNDGVLRRYILDDKKMYERTTFKVPVNHEVVFYQYTENGKLAVHMMNFEENKYVVSIID